MKNESPKKDECVYVASKNDNYILIIMNCNLFKVGEEININKINVDTIYKYELHND
jgi:hypothetical protein